MQSVLFLARVHSARLHYTNESNISHPRIARLSTKYIDRSKFANSTVAVFLWKRGIRLACFQQRSRHKGDERKFNSSRLSTAELISTIDQRVESTSAFLPDEKNGVITRKYFRHGRKLMLVTDSFFHLPSGSSQRSERRCPVTFSSYHRPFLPINVIFGDSPNARILRTPKACRIVASRTSIPSFSGRKILRLRSALRARKRPK